MMEACIQRNSRGLDIHHSSASQKTGPGGRFSLSGMAEGVFQGLLLVERSLLLSQSCRESNPN